MQALALEPVSQEAVVHAILKGDISMLHLPRLALELEDPAALVSLIYQSVLQILLF